MRAAVERWLNQLWYQHRYIALLFYPLSYLYCLFMRIRQSLYQHNILYSTKLAAPVIIVGNLTAGGTGKTPFVIWLAGFLRVAGYKPGIVCSGYRGKETQSLQTVSADSDPLKVSDEAVLLAQRTQCPVVAYKNRVAAGQVLLYEHDCDIVICDDGLQHYRLQRDIEIALLDSERGLGNGLCLPAGPLREPIKRLQHADMVISKGESPLADWHISVSCHQAYALHNPDDCRLLTDFRQQTVHAVAGIAAPNSFFKCLRAAGLDILEKPYPDHYVYSMDELDFGDKRPVLMTEKDAVKYCTKPLHDSWVVPLEIQISDNFSNALLARLATLRS